MLQKKYLIFRSITLIVNCANVRRKMTDVEKEEERKSDVADRGQPQDRT